MELCTVLDPERPLKADKVAILNDASRRLNQLRLEAQKLKESNESLRDTIKSLKVKGPLSLFVVLRHYLAYEYSN